MSKVYNAKSVFKLSDTVYDVLIAFTLYVIPATGALYFGLANTWGLGFGEEVLGSFLMLETFLGAVLGISRSKHKKEPEVTDGRLVIDETDPMKDTFSLEVGQHVFDLQDREVLKLEVQREESQ